MAKDTRSLKNKYFTKSSLRIIAFNTFTMLVFYAVFNVFFFALLNRQLDKEIDLTLRHEMEHFQQGIRLQGDSMKIANLNHEFDEPALKQINGKAYLLQIVDRHGKFLYQSPNIRHLSGIPIRFPLYSDKTTFVTYRVDGYELRTGYLPVKKNGKFYGLIQLSTFKAAGKKILNKILFFDLVSFPIILLFVLGIAYLNAQQYLAPIRKIIQVTRHISIRDLNQRLTFKADPSDEMGQLRDTLNHLFDRLQTQINEIKQFTDNASHQLMSPLTVMKTELEFITRRKHQNSECRQSFEVLIQQTDRMIDIVKTLLILAKDDQAGQTENAVFPIEKILNRLKSFYPERVRFPKEVSNLFLKGNPDYFLMALQNIIDNALKYSSEDKDVDVELQTARQQVRIRIKDQGPGIPDDEKRRIFERFYRGRQTSDKEGYGLGLSLVESVIKNMEGKVVVKDNKPHGTVFEIVLKTLHLE